MQKTSFFDDKKILDQIHSGKSFRLGNFHEHHLFLFHLNKPYSPVSTDFTNEILTYGLESSASDFLKNTKLSSSEIREFFQFEQFFPNFHLDDFVFNPFGYSINGVYEEDYLLFMLLLKIAIATSVLKPLSHLNRLKIVFFPIFYAYYAQNHLI